MMKFVRHVMCNVYLYICPTLCCYLLSLHHIVICQRMRLLFLSYVDRFLVLGVAGLCQLSGIVIWEGYKTVIF